MTKNAVAAKLTMLTNFAAITKSISDQLCNMLLDVPDDGLFDLMDKIQSCELTDVKEIMSRLEEDGYLEDCDEEVDYLDYFIKSLPEVKLTDVLVEVAVPVDGGKLLIGTSKSDDNTEQVYISYEVAETDSIIDLVLAEVKSGEIAELDNKPSDNKDIDLYLYEDAYSEDWTYKATLTHEDIVKATTYEEDENGDSN